MTRRHLAFHLFVLVLLLVIAGGIATLRGELWPFDIRATLLMTASGLAATLRTWGLVWLAALVASALLPRIGWRLLLWLVALATVVAFHATLGPARGLAPAASIGPIGLVALYAVPAALAVLVGSALGEALPRRRAARA